MQKTIEFLGISVLMFDFWNTISPIAMYSYVILHIRNYLKICPAVQRQKDRRRGLIIGWAEYIVVFGLTGLLVLFLNDKFGDWFTSGNANYFGTLTAWMISVTVLTSVFRVSPLRVHDFVVPALPFSLFFAKLGCFSVGCCSGFELDGGIFFNSYTDRYEFPVQLVEAAVALALFFYMRWYVRHNKRVGSAFPLYLTVYSASRFLTEFLRDDFPNVLGPFDAYQVMSVIYIAIGAALMFVVYKYGAAIEARFKKALKTKKQ